MTYTFSQRLTLAIVPPIAALIIRAVGLTLRYEDVFAEDYGELIRGDAIPGAAVYAFWHRSLLTCAHRFKGRDVAIMISRSFDGELIARTVESMGFRVVRGSSSRGGTSALRGMVDAYGAGRRCAFAADGPRGPALVAQAGPVQLAKLVDAPCVGVFHARPLSAWELKTWDRFLIPKPFSRVVLTWPKRIPAAEVTLTRVQAALDEAVAMAEGVR